MIAKRIFRDKGASSFERLGAYVLNAKGDVDPASWTRLNAYILDAERQGEKVGWARVTNCQADDPGWAVKEIAATQGRNTRSRSDKSYHLVVSFPEGEKPTREQLEDIEDTLCAAIGFAEHQRVSAVHQNTDNWHLHVAINKVHPRTLRNVAPLRDHFRLQEACAELERRHGLTQEPHTIDRAQSRRGKVRGRAADFEAHHGGQSFAGWVQEHAAEALLAARDCGRGWLELHRAAAAYDLEIRPRGAGLVIGHRGDKRLHVKASEIDRGLSMQALTAALGQYQEPSAEAALPGASYERPARTGPLYRAFRRKRDAAIQAKDAALAQLRAQHRAYARDLAGWYRERFRQEKARDLRGVLRRESFRHLIEKRREDQAARVLREAEERRQVRAAHRIPSWHGYLETEAARGDEAALAMLRNRRQREQRLEAEMLQAENAAEAKHVVYRHLRPAIRSDGRVIYRVEDGGLVSDEARQVRVAQTTSAATFLALTLAADRFGHRPLVVRGSDDFRSQVADLAGMQSMKVSFADPQLESRRVLAAHQNAHRDGGRNDANGFIRRDGQDDDRGR